jgi:hypothetical protein
MAAVNSQETAYVVLSRQKHAPEPAQVAALASELDMDPYSARQRLLVPSPTIMRRESSYDAALRVVVKFTKLGIATFTVTESALAAITPRTVRFLSKASKGFDVEFLDGTTEFLRAKSIILMCRATLESRVVRETEQGDPMLGNVASVRETESKKQVTVLDVHAPSENGIYRFSDDTFDFGRLYPGRATTTGPMMQKLIQWIRDAAPGAPVWDEFDSVRGLLGIQNKLIEEGSALRHSWFSRPFHARLSVQRSKVVLQSDEAAFQAFSALGRMQMILTLGSKVPGTSNDGSESWHPDDATRRE